MSASVCSHSDTTVFLFSAVICGLNSGSRLLYMCGELLVRLVHVGCLCMFHHHRHINANVLSLSCISQGIFLGLKFIFTAFGTESLNLLMRCFAPSFTPSGANRNAIKPLESLELHRVSQYLLPEVCTFFVLIACNLFVRVL